ncbi:MAG: flagellar motor protein MotB [Burkholderiales bacterium PBB3]|nr:MAG: flagellar motor protein MotB [Burkholderiales bacterium PBB3]
MSVHLNHSGRVATLVLAVLASACSTPPPPPPRSYVALLPDVSGSVGQVTVKGQLGEQKLTQASQATLLNGSGASFVVSPEQLQKDFGAVLAASPVLPEQFLLYFESGGAALTADSEKLLLDVVARAQVRKSVDMSVIGHSDTQGKAEANEALALQRAQSIASRLSGLGIASTAITIESHGERNLLVPTPDETVEPRNRRVEITLR